MISSRPRNLRLLRIDDRLEAQRIRPFDGIKACSLIMNWKQAREFWRAFDLQQAPDLVTADVQFDEDRRTPLYLFPWRDRDKQKIPTGLSHLKAVAGLARGLDSPLGIGLHNADDKQWTIFAREGKVMGALAVHEIGEIAAILGDEGDLSMIDEGENLLLASESWLSAKNGRDFRGALKLALVDYRGKLIERVQSRGEDGIIVPPADWVRLQNWCEHAQLTPEPREISDIGVSLLFGNGRRDYISIASMFADARAGGCSLKRVPSACFEVKMSDEPPWELGMHSVPRIGAFVYVLGEIARPVERACELLERIFTGSQPEIEDNAFLRGLIILFLMIRIEKANFDVWREAFTQYGWNHEKRAFDHEDYDGESLQTALQRIVRNIGTDKYEPKTKEDLEDEMPYKDLAWCLNLLVAMGAISKEEIHRGTHGYLGTGKQIATPPLEVVAQVPNGLTQNPEKVTRGNVARRIGVTSRALNEWLANAFCHAGGRENEKLGSKFWNRFKAGNGPVRLVEICRDYAENRLNWSDQQTWPLSIRPRDS